MDQRVASSPVLGSAHVWWWSLQHSRAAAALQSLRCGWSRIDELFHDGALLRVGPPLCTSVMFKQSSKVCWVTILVLWWVEIQRLRLQRKSVSKDKSYPICFREQEICLPFAFFFFVVVVILICPNDRRNIISQVLGGMFAFAMAHFYTQSAQPLPQTIALTNEAVVWAKNHNASIISLRSSKHPSNLPAHKKYRHRSWQLIQIKPTLK